MTECFICFGRRPAWATSSEEVSTSRRLPCRTVKWKSFSSNRVSWSDTGPPKSKFDKGDRVKVKDGTFAGMEGEVKEVLEAKGALKVELTIFGRPVPVELEYWQVDYP